MKNFIWQKAASWTMTAAVLIYLVVQDKPKPEMILLGVILSVVWQAWGDIISKCRRRQ
jgi:hypothetical protein